MYGKIFDSMYDGTLADDWRALVTFQQMIVLCDADGVIDLTPSAISRRTGIPIEHIKAGLDILENPDPYSRTENEEGRRIQLLDEHKPWGWYIVNHNKYRSLQDKDTVREQNRLRKQKQRAKAKESQAVTDGHAPSRHTDADASKKKQVKKKATSRFVSPTVDQIRDYLKEKYNDKEIIDADYFVRYYKSNGWKVGRNKMVCWKSTVGNWVSKEKKQVVTQSNISQVEQELVARLTGPKTNPVPFKLAESEQAWRKLPPNKWDFRSDYEMKKAISEVI